MNKLILNARLKFGGILLVIFAGLISQVVLAQVSFQEQVNLPFNGRYGTISFTINEKIYCGMGWDGATDKGDLWEFNPHTNIWSEKTGYPVGRRLASVFVIQGKAYICGGTNISGVYSNVLNDVIEYNPANDTWIEKASIPVDGLYGAAGFTIGNKGYLCCGNMGSSNGPYSKKLWEYEPANDTWSSKTDFPGNERYGITYSRFVIGTNAYVGLGMGKLQNNTNYFYNDMYCYNQELNTWSSIKEYPRKGSSYSI